MVMFYTGSYVSLPSLLSKIERWNTHLMSREVGDDVSILSRTQLPAGVVQRDWSESLADCGVLVVRHNNRRALLRIGLEPEEKRMLQGSTRILVTRIEEVDEVLGGW